MKDFESHRQDIQNEFQTGDHVLSWDSHCTHWINGYNGEYCFSIYFTTSPSNPKQEICFYLGDIYINGLKNIHEGLLRGNLSDNYQADKDFCQNYYLNFLAKERCNGH